MDVDASILWQSNHVGGWPSGLGRRLDSRVFAAFEFQHGEEDCLGQGFYQLATLASG